MRWLIRIIVMILIIAIVPIFVVMIVGPSATGPIVGILAAIGYLIWSIRRARRRKKRANAGLVF